MTAIYSNSQVGISSGSIVGQPAGAASQIGAMDPQMLQAMLQSGQLNSVMKSLGISLPTMAGAGYGGTAANDPLSMLMGGMGGMNASSPAMRDLQAMQAFAQAMGGGAGGADDSDDDSDE